MLDPGKTTAKQKGPTARITQPAALLLALYKRCDRVDDSLTYAQLLSA